MPEVFAPAGGPLDDLPDVRDGLSRKQRVVLWVLGELQAERGDRNVPLPLLYGRVLEHVELSIAELQQIVARLGNGCGSRTIP